MNTTTNALPLPDASAFPDALVRTPHWVGYAWEVRGEKRTKVPKNPHTGRNGSSTDPATWADFATARDFALRHGYGLGFMLAPPFVGIDLDHCRDAATGELSTLGLSVLSNLDTYAEVSVSGTGVKAIAYGEKPGERCRKNGRELEIYSVARLFALTGQRLDDAPLQINDCQDAINHIYTAAFGQTDPTPRTPPPTFVTTDDDRAVLDWLTTHNPKFAPLWAGDTGAYNGDQSAADQALCNMLAFRTGDEHRVDSLFRQSGLYRPKWERGDYRHRTITKAMQQRRFFTPPRATLSSVDSPPWEDGSTDDLSSVDSPTPDGITGDCAARLALLEREHTRLHEALDKERAHRKAVHALITNDGMTPVERVIAYGLIFAVASAVSRDAHADADPEARPVNCSAIAENVGLKPQTVSANIRRFAERGQLRKVTSPKATRDGKTYPEIAVHLPGTTVLENLRAAASWTRPEGTPHVGGNGRRCPKCASTAFKRTERTATVLTTTLACAGCGHIHDERTKELPGAKTYVEYGDFTDTPAMLDLAAMPGERTLSSVDSPPRPETAPAPDLATGDTLSSVDTPLAPHDSKKTVERPRIIPRYPPPDAPTLTSVDSPLAAPWDGTHDCTACGRTCYARAGTVPRCQPCTRRLAPAWDAVPAADD
jgi:ribosomal protein L37AE/L43A